MHTDPSHPPGIELVVLDMAGTTVADDGLVIEAFDAAATAVGLSEDGEERELARKYVVDTMGQSKIDVFRALFDTEERAQLANAAFEQAYDLAVDGGIRPISGAAEAVAGLRAAGIQTAFTTGFSALTQRRVLAALGWEGAVDHVLAPGDGVRGRPYPDLVLVAALAARVDHMANVVVVGDTTSDMRSGRSAGAGTVVGVLTGAHDEAALRSAGATHVVASVADLDQLTIR